VVAHQELVDDHAQLVGVGGRRGHRVLVGIGGVGVRAEREHLPRGRGGATGERVRLGQTHLLDHRGALGVEVRRTVEIGAGDRRERRDRGTGNL